MSRAPRTYPTRGASGRGAHSEYEALATGLGWFSVGLGLAELVAPRALCRALGMEGKENLVRAYGARECVAGVAILMSHDPTPWIWGRVAGDAVDLASLVTDYPEQSFQRGNRTLATIAVAGVTILDIACARGLTVDKRLASRGTYDYSGRTGFPKSARAMRGAASDFEVPADYSIPDPLRPWKDGQPAVPGPTGTKAQT